MEETIRVPTVRDAMETVSAVRIVNRKLIFRTETPEILAAFSSNPKILILDEPTTGMDTVSVKALAKVLQKRNEEQGLTILMVTHGNSNEFKGANRFFKAEEGRIDEV